MYRIVELRVLPDYTLYARFEDGVDGRISLKNDLEGPVFGPLRDPAIFAKAAISQFGVICWPNGADIASDALYEDFCKTASNKASRQS